jgi:hypothetical protein
MIGYLLTNFDINFFLKFPLRKQNIHKQGVMSSEKLRTVYKSDK